LKCNIYATYDQRKCFGVDVLFFTGKLVYCKGEISALTDGASDQDRNIKAAITIQSNNARVIHG